MAILSTEEKAFYKSLFTVLNEPHINDLFVKYTQMQYNKAITALKKAKDTHEIGRLQGKIEAYDDYIALKNTVTDIVRNGV